MAAENVLLTWQYLGRYLAGMAIVTDRYYREVAISWPGFQDLVHLV